MFKSLCLSALGLMCFNATMAGEHILTLEGQYQNKNLYVSNSVSSSGVGFCAYEVRVNGEVTTDEVNSTAFEIDLSQLKLVQGAPVTVQIMYRDGCAPKVLNPTVLKPQATFEIQNIEVTQEGLLKWSTKDESGSLPFNIEVYKWNKWVKVGEVQGEGTSELNNYSFKVGLISGENKIRVTQKGTLGKTEQSQSVTVVSEVEKPSWNFESGKNKIIFSKETAYEIYDKFGQARIKGFGKEIDVVSLNNDEYYLCYDNSVESFHKK